MHGILWDPQAHPAELDVEPGPTDVVVMLRNRDGHEAIGIVVAAGSAVLTMRAGDVVRFPMLDVTDRAPSRLIGFAKIPTNGALLLRIPLAEYNADAHEPERSIAIDGFA